MLKEKCFNCKLFVDPVIIKPNNDVLPRYKKCPNCGQWLGHIEEDKEKISLIKNDRGIKLERTLQPHKNKELF